MTSMPASRSARAMTFAPRSWPSSPGFATNTRILRSSGICVGAGALSHRSVPLFLARAGIVVDPAVSGAGAPSCPHRAHCTRRLARAPAHMLSRPTSAERSVHADAAVDGERLACDESRLGQAEKTDGCRHVFSGPEATHRRDAQHIVAHLLVDGGGELGWYKAWGNRVRSDAAGGDLACGGLGQGDESRLGSRI